MNVRISELYSLVGGTIHNITSSDVERIIDWCHLIETSSITKPADAHMVCYFAVYEPAPEWFGWYDVVVDNRPKVMPLFLRYPHWIFVVESNHPHLQELISSECKLVVVSDIRVAARRVYDYVLQKVNPEVIGVTGSVGKTTCVALLEDALSVHAPTLRIYSKRLSPLSIMTVVINQLTEEHRYIVMEYSLYRSWHIDALCELLPPTVAVMLNIKDTHLGVGGLQSRFDIFMGKVPLLRHAHTNTVASELAAYPLPKRDLSFFGIDDRSLIRFVSSDRTFHVGESTYVILVPIMTRLMVMQILATISVMDKFGLPIDIDVFERFRPKENRLSVHTYEDTTVIFDGDATYGARMSALADHFFGDDAGLVIVQQCHSQDPIEQQIQEFAKVRNGFKTISILDKVGEDWMHVLAPILQPDYIFKESELGVTLKRHKVTFVHAGGWYRSGPQILLPFTV